jgi:hypothetical protein
MGQSYLFDVHDPDKLLIGESDSPTGDLPRNDQGLALIDDARNDTHLFVSQLHLAFLHFHNLVGDSLRDAGVKPSEVIQRAARMVRWHYQWIALHEVLPLSVGDDLLAELLESGAKLRRFQGRAFWRTEAGSLEPVGLATLRFERSTMSTQVSAVSRSFLGWLEFVR